MAFFSFLIWSLLVAHPRNLDPVWSYAFPVAGFTSHGMCYGKRLVNCKSPSLMSPWLNPRYREGSWLAAWPSIGNIVVRRWDTAASSPLQY
ncbi:hypothetical protein V8F20_010974 [Naviculisporaceae sp. PSN 640]